MESIKGLSIRKTIVLYIFITLIISYILSYFVIHQARWEQQGVWQKYMEGVSIKERPNQLEMSDKDKWISELCDFLQTYSILLITSVGVVFAVCLFYKNKLQNPLKELSKASEEIGNNNLDFTISYSNRDEMGQLCRDFEVMRLCLVKNNQQLWGMVEKEKALRTSIAHDIRSPLAILKGYQEIMLEYGGTLDQDMRLDMLQEGMAQIQRIEEFLNIMQKLSSLEERYIQMQEVVLIKLAKQYRKNMEMLSNGKECELLLKTEKETIVVDVEIVTEVLENLLVNAFRYAKKKVLVQLFADSKAFYIEVQDDGQGFTEDTEVLTRPYYHANPQDDLTHFGIGLYLCRIYCEKHGGKLLLGNWEYGGRAKAIFAFGDKEGKKEK